MLKSGRLARLGRVIGPTRKARSISLATSAACMFGEMSTAMSTLMPGRAARIRSMNRDSQRWTIVSETPRRRVPIVRPVSARAAPISAWSDRNRSANPNRTRPRSVSATSRLRRSKSVPYSCSSAAMRCDTAGWVVFTCSLARRKLDSVATQ